MLTLRTLTPFAALSSDSTNATGDLGAADISIGAIPANAALIRTSQQATIDWQGVRITPYGGNTDNNTGTMRMWLATPDNVGLYLGAVTITLGTLTHTFPFSSTSQRLADTLTMTSPAFRTVFEGVYGTIGLYSNASNGGSAVILKNIAGANLLLQFLCDGGSPAARLNASVCLMV